MWSNNKKSEVEQKFYIIGLTDSNAPYLMPEVLEHISRGTVFSGGLRHYEIVKEILPIGSKWINITVPLDKVFKEYEGYNEVIVFASGDPLFFGFANTVINRLPQADVKVYPAFNSLQLLAQACNIAYQDMRCVSLTGRPWHEFDKALINQEKVIGLLTDRNHTPSTIAQRMLDYGYTDYEFIVGERLGNESDQKCTWGEVSEMVNMTFEMPNCIILKQTARKQESVALGIPDNQFMPLDGRLNMITKMPIRLISLSKMDLHRKKTLWDVGFCTGSVSIEAKRLFPHLHIEAFEIRESGLELMEVNSKRFGCPGINAHIGDFLDTDIRELPPPDAVFIGGHGGKLIEIVKKLKSVMTDEGILVFNSVSQDSATLFLKAIDKAGMKIEEQSRVALDDYNPITIFKAVKQTK